MTAEPPAVAAGDIPDPALARAAVAKVLGSICQGDLLSLGAVTLVGVGSSAAWESTAQHEGGSAPPPSGQLWSLTIESDVGWYVVITQDCDIVRAPDDEPCLVVCPLRYVSPAHWQRLRSGPGSPREFPFPEGHIAPAADGGRPIADLRFVTSVDKTALLHPSVYWRQALSGPQRSTFRRWVGARYARVPHPDVLERDVLPKAARVVRKLAGRFEAGDKADPEVRLVGAADRWYLGGNDKRVLFIPMLSEARARAAGLWDATAGNFDGGDLSAGATRLSRKLRAGLPAGGGYTCAVEPVTLHGASAADLMEWAEWAVEAPIDPLG